MISMKNVEQVLRSNGVQLNGNIVSFDYITNSDERLRAEGRVQGFEPSLSVVLIVEPHSTTTFNVSAQVSSQYGSGIYQDVVEILFGLDISRAVNEVISAAFYSGETDNIMGNGTVKNLDESKKKDSMIVTDYSGLEGYSSVFGATAETLAESDDQMPVYESDYLCSLDDIVNYVNQNSFRVGTLNVKLVPDSRVTGSQFYATGYINVDKPHTDIEVTLQIKYISEMESFRILIALQGMLDYVEYGNTETDLRKGDIRKFIESNLLAAFNESEFYRSLLK